MIIRVDAPSRMARAAPKAAPLEAPRMSGEAMGLWNTPWKAAPAAERAQPTRQAITIRGRRMFTTAISICSVQVLSRVPRPANSSRNRVHRILTTVRGGTPYRPREKETRNRNRRASPITSNARQAFRSLSMAAPPSRYFYVKITLAYSIPRPAPFVQPSGQKEGKVLPGPPFRGIYLPYRRKDEAP